MWPNKATIPFHQHPAISEKASTWCGFFKYKWDSVIFECIRRNTRSFQKIIEHYFSTYVLLVLVPSKYSTPPPTFPTDVSTSQTCSGKLLLKQHFWRICAYVTNDVKTASFQHTFEFRELKKSRWAESGQ